MLLFNDDLMRLFVRLVLPACFICLLVACHRPTAYFQRTSHAPAARLSIDESTFTPEARQDSFIDGLEPINVPVTVTEPTVASVRHQSTASPTKVRIERRMLRIQSLLTTPAGTVDKQPRPRPKQKLKLGNQIREKLGVPLRKDLNWWQKISWKLKASAIVILVAVVFAIANITILAIIFGILGAFLLITGLKKSMKVRRPWF